MLRRQRHQINLVLPRETESLSLPECLQAPSSLLSRLQTLCWGQHLPTLLSPAESRPQSYSTAPKFDTRSINV